MARIYDVSISEDGTERALGTLAFADDNSAVLTLSGDTEAHRRLRERWDEIAARPALEVPRTRREKMDDGSWMRLSVIETVARDSPDYPPAVVQYLGWTYGYDLARRLAPVTD